MKKYLITFGDPDNYYNTGLKLKESATSYFDDIHVYNFSNIDSEFYSKNKDILNSEKGRGYWLWKPYFIKRVLNSMDENDILMYCDCRCLFINNPISILEFQENENIKAFHVPGNFLNKNWTKFDCFVNMQCFHPKYYNGRQYNAAFQVYKNNEFSRKFINEYLDQCENKNNITDIANIHGPNFDPFEGHRHDQSIFSLLCIKYNITGHRSPCQWGDKVKEEYSQDNYPSCILHHRQFLK